MMEPLQNLDISLQKNAYKQKFGNLGSLEPLLTHGTLDKKHCCGAMEVTDKVQGEG